MIFAFLISIFGFAIVFRMLNRLDDQHWFDEKELTKIGTAYFAIVFILIITLPRSYLSAWTAVFAPVVTIAIVLYALVINRSSRFRQKIRESLTLISLKMKSGRSFRQSLMEVNAESDVKMRAKLSEISNAVVFSQHKPQTTATPFIKEVIHELTLIDRNPHTASKRLSNYREKLRIEDDFRRRSGQVLARIRAQSIVMSGLYIAVLIFMILKFGWKANSTAMISSMILFCAGGAWIWIGGRRLKWKV